MSIGTRTLTLATSTGVVEILIQVFAPTLEGARWDCRYEINWPDGLWQSHAQGNDALHALQLALQKIGVDIYMSPYHKSGQLSWMKPWVWYGFEVPKDARDLLIGTDKLFYG